MGRVEGVNVVWIVRSQGVRSSDQPVLHRHREGQVAGEANVGAGDRAPGVGVDVCVGHHHRDGLVRLKDVEEGPELVVGHVRHERRLETGEQRGVAVR